MTIRAWLASIELGIIYRISIRTSFTSNRHWIPERFIRRTQSKSIINLINTSSINKIKNLASRAHNSLTFFSSRIKSLSNWAYNRLTLIRCWIQDLTSWAYNCLTFSWCWIVSGSRLACYWNNLTFFCRYIVILCLVTYWYAF